MPRTRDELLLARKAAFYGSEERATGFFPLAPGRLWHSGVHLRGAWRRARGGADPRAPGRGPRRGERGGSSTSFVLIRHEVEVEGQVIVFFSLLAHLALPAVRAGQRRALDAGADAARAGRQRAEPWSRGTVTLLDERVETGDLLGYVGHVDRGPEQGPELHFEIFTADKLPADLDRGFRYLNATTDGPIARARRPGHAARQERRRPDRASGAGLRVPRRGPDQAPGPAPGGDPPSPRMGRSHDARASSSGLRELSGVPEAERRRLYGIAIAPYLFWNDALAEHAGLPRDQIIYSYNPLTFLLTLAARATHVDIPWPREVLTDASLEPRRLSLVPLVDWTKPPTTLPAELKLPPLIGSDLGPKRRDQIPLIELESTDHR